MSGKYFADTNVLVYAFDNSEPAKQLIAQQILDEQHVDVNLLLPLIDATVEKLKYGRAIDNQTGPALRGDQNILDMHQQMLSNRHDWQTLYLTMSQGIQQRAK